MTKMIVLFSLKATTNKADYEAWARAIDLPTARRLQSIDSVEILRCTTLLGSSSAPPYQYIEIIDINSLDAFGNEVSASMMKKIADEFREFVEAPQFIVTEHI